ncbi:hypothetical protein OIU77_009986 [Salix suchowensis]|uniref:Uncharacterized protein n=1 Tax=Salix suchowensis TaxID=1278906 RepID=A0ABQ9A8J1_9ROSI|nr:hypothetical protein OIU78_016045 [Salix suchowensis]KAJ6328202.1 hypothetical protein OIU77_009986 [Salix suchowensis]
MVSPNFIIIFPGTCDSAGGRVLWENVVWLVWFLYVLFSLRDSELMYKSSMQNGINTHLCDHDAYCRAWCPSFIIFVGTCEYWRGRFM